MVPRLVSLLEKEVAGDEGADLHYAAMIALGRMGEHARAAIPTLVRTIESEDWVNPAIIETLGRIGPDARAAIPRLLNALKTSDDGDRPALLAALTEIDPEGKQSLATFISLLGVRVGKPDFDERRARDICKAIGRLGPNSKPAVPVLIELYKRQELKIRRASLDALGRIGAGSLAAVPVMIDTLKGPDRRMAAIAAQALGRIGPAAKEAMPVLLDLIGKGRRVDAEIVFAAVAIEPRHKKTIRPIVDKWVGDLPNYHERTQINLYLDRKCPQVGSIVQARVGSLTEWLLAENEVDDQGWLDAVQYSFERVGECGQCAALAIPMLNDLKNHRSVHLRRWANDALSHISVTE